MNRLPATQQSSVGEQLAAPSCVKECQPQGEPQVAPLPSHPILAQRWRPPLTPLLARIPLPPDALLGSAERIPQCFFQRAACTLAVELLGCLLVHNTPAGPVGGLIVETEAYRQQDDPGCHAHRGLTPRNRHLFAAGGHAYVYLIYGMYHCLNIAAGAVGEGTGVLLRGIEPVWGLAHMQRNRAGANIPMLSNGPGRLTRALGVDLAQGGLPVWSGESSLRVLRLPKRLQPNLAIRQSTRVNVTAPPSDQYEWRFYVEDNPFVSRPWHGQPLRTK